MLPHIATDRQSYTINHAIESKASIIEPSSTTAAPASSIATAKDMPRFAMIALSSVGSNSIFTFDRNYDLLKHESRQCSPVAGIGERSGSPAIAHFQAFHGDASSTERRHHGVRYDAVE